MSAVLGLTLLPRLEKERALLEVPVESCPSSLPHLAVRACGRSNEMILTGILPTYAYVKTEPPGIVAGSNLCDEGVMTNKSELRQRAVRKVI